MTEGLMLTMSGEKPRTILLQRIEDHEQRAEWWRDQQARTPEKPGVR